jgi:hypothetical protein
MEPTVETLHHRNPGAQVVMCGRRTFYRPERRTLNGDAPVRMKGLRTVFAMAACLGALACSSAPGEPDGASRTAIVPADAASIIGDIAQVERTGGRLRILVQQIPTRSAGYPIAWIAIGGGTDVVQRAGGSVSRGSSAELAVGMRVQAWFTGPVAESYPVQATAGTVLIER